MFLIGVQRLIREPYLPDHVIATEGRIPRRGLRR